MNIIFSFRRYRKRACSEMEARARFWSTVLDKPGPTHVLRQQEIQVTRHITEHNRYQCNLGWCGRTFKQRAHLNQHNRAVHMKLKPFLCVSCDRAFGKRFDLNSHVSAVHLKHRPHVCRICTVSFSKRSNLKRHQRKLHFL